MTRPSSGLQQLDRLIDTLAQRAHRRPPPALFWDVDGTLFDPAPRMLHTVRAFGVEHATLEDVWPTWERTAHQLALDAETFFGFWYEHYWEPAHFLHDAPIQPTLERLRRAQDRGIHNVVITGRTIDNHNITAHQLARQNVVPDTLVLRPHDAPETAAFKADALSSFAAQGLLVAALVTDSVAEILAAQHATVAWDPPPQFFYVAYGRGPHDLESLPPGTHVLIGDHD